MLFQNNKIIFLIGLPGSGKTHIGKLISKSLSWNFIDMDSYIEKKSKKLISEIFFEYGESYFRKFEHETLNELKNLENTIISTGGGCILSKKNKSILRKYGISIWLKANPTTIHARLKNSNKENVRPLLGEKVPVKKISELLEKRKNHYSIADIVITTDNKTAKDVNDEILKIIRSNDIGK
ncbi:MAG: shikimate kinase [Dehalococcoidia bacterium]